MTARVGLVTDSSSQIPPELARRYEVEVVPLTVTVDGVAYLEGEELDADAFWDRFRLSAPPQVSTSQPSPGRFAEAYRAVAERGADEILSVHIGSNTSGTVGSARLAARSALVPVRVVDTGTASFGVTCCLWEAAEALWAGATADEAGAAALAVAGRLGMVFVVRALDLARAGGRLSAEADASGGGVPVLTMAGGSMEVVAEAGDLAEAAELMAVRARAAGTGLRVGVGVADAGAEPLARCLCDRLTGAPEVAELVRYRVGPSVGAHTGPGTVGAVYYRPGWGTVNEPGRR